MEQDNVVVIDISDLHFPTKEGVRTATRRKEEIVKPVVEYSLEGEMLNIYDNANVAGKILEVSPEIIRQCCVGINNKFCKKLQRIFLYRGDDITERLKELDRREEVKWKRGLERSIDEYNLKGRFLTVYPSQKIAAQCNKVSTVAVGDCCRGKKLYIGNRIFLHHGDDIERRLPLVKKKLFLESQRRKKCIPVDEYTLDGKFVKGYVSASDAARATDCHLSNILDCCRGLNHSSKHDYLQLNGRIFLFAGESISERLEYIKSKQKEL